ncbi:MAG: hypothetical protein M1832_004625 [Thelocarpon impressellum]|nr:MAG: hypothetical protein M1832_004625 [Thelocarpon impressellum]
MPLVRKRRAPENAEEDPSGPSSDDDEVSDGPTGSRQRRRSTSDADLDMDRSGNFTAAEGMTRIDGDGVDAAQLVKKLVRLALACEYARQPIRRQDIGSKVLGSNGRRFKVVFEGAQRVLKATFGMEMVELPVREKVTISQRRAAQRTDKASTTSKVWVLTSVLPDKYRLDERIVPPPKVPTSETEATYVGLYTFLISVIYMSGGSISESKLERYMKRTNADQHTPIDRTEKLLLRLCKEGYLVKVRDTSGGDEIVEYMVGPRGKIEVGVDGVVGVAKTVYGDMASDDIEDKVRRSMGIDEGKRQKPRGRNMRQEDDDEDGDEDSSQTPRGSRGDADDDD